MVQPKRKVRLGDMLISKGIIDDIQLHSALAQQKSTGRRLGQTLVDMGYVEEDALLNILSELLEIPFVRLRQYQFDQNVVSLLPESQARRHRAIVLSKNGDELLVGMSDPMDIFAYDELTRILKQPFDQAVVRESELLETLDTVYSLKSDISQFAEDLQNQLAEDTFDLASLSEGTTDDEAPVVRLLQSVFEDAVAMRASDIHIEPEETALRIRQRIDGQLHEQVIQEKRISNAVVLRLKLMCGLNISEKRLPQDGRFSIRVKGRPIDVRLSTMPMQSGESVVMRLLDQSEGVLDLNSTGMPTEILGRFRNLIARPHGLVLVTGPTGSGKTTTLYGALNEINKPDVKIITAEDPVEYRLPRLTQVQVNPKIELGFATVLRAALRQDPDIILIGEMRDTETAEIGLRAALTGHLVLSTLHTNDAVSSAWRLMDMGMEPYLVASALSGVLAQRLIRRVCEHCSEPKEPDPQQRMWLRQVTGSREGQFVQGQFVQGQFVQGHGCYHCGNTGYHGRMGVYELLELDEPMLDALRLEQNSELSRLAEQSPGHTSLAMSALQDARVGKTSLNEVFRLIVDSIPVAEPEQALDQAV